MNLKAAVIIPPIQDFYFTRHRFSALGATIVRDILEKSGVSTQLFNFPIEEDKTVKIPPALSFLDPYIIKNETGRFSFFTRYHRYGPQTDQCVSRILDSKPDICFISCFAFCYAQEAVDIAKELKLKIPNMTVVGGGAGASSYPEYFLNRSFDFILTGEAEVSVKEFIDCYKNQQAFKGVSNLVWKDNCTITKFVGSSFTTSSQISFLMNKTHETPHAIYVTTSLSRGCPRQCTFCANHLIHGKVFRKIPVETIKSELENFPIDLNGSNKRICMNFEDDNLLMDSDYFFAALRIFKDQFPRAEFYAENGIDFLLLTPEICDKLVLFGFKQFNLSIASTNIEILQTVKRQHDSSHYEKITCHIAKHNLPCITYFICGFPGDTKDSISHNLAYLLKIQTVIGISPFYPIPGIEGYRDFSLFDTHPPYLCSGSSCYPWNNSLSTKTIVTAFRIARYINVLNSKFKSEDELEVIQTIQKTGKLHTIIKNRVGVKEVVCIPNQDEELVEMFFAKSRVGQNIKKADRFPGDKLPDLSQRTFDLT